MPRNSLRRASTLVVMSLLAAVVVTTSSSGGSSVAAEPTSEPLGKVAVPGDCTYVTSSGFSSFWTEQEYKALPTWAEMRAEKLAPGVGETNRITVTLGDGIPKDVTYPEGFTGKYFPQPSGTRSVRINAGGNEIVAYGGSGDARMVENFNTYQGQRFLGYIDFLAPNSWTDETISPYVDENGDQIYGAQPKVFDSNKLFGPGDTFWVEYVVRNEYAAQSHEPGMYLKGGRHGASFGTYSNSPLTGVHCFRNDVGLGATCNFDVINDGRAVHLRHDGNQRVPGGPYFWEMVRPGGQSFERVPGPNGTSDDFVFSGDPGQYVFHIVYDDGAIKLTDTCAFTLEGPALDVTVVDLDARFGGDETGTRMAIGNEFTARVTVRSRGANTLKSLAPVGPLLHLPDQLELVDAVEVVAPFDLPSGQSRTFDVKLRAVKAGSFRVRSTWDGDDAGAPAGPMTGDFGGAVEGLKITVVPDPATKELEKGPGGDLIPQPVGVDVTVENVSGADLTNVVLDGPLDWSPLNDQESLADVELRFADEADVTEAFGEEGRIVIGTLKTGAENAFTYHYDLDAYGWAHAELEQVVAAEQGEAVLHERGTADLRIGGLYLEFDTSLTKPAPPGLLPAGEAIRIEGTIRNISSDKTIEVGPPPPTVAGNAGNMSVVWDPTGEDPDPLNPVVPGIRTLKPGEEVDFLVRITTQWSDPRLTGVAPSGGTFAQVEFTPWGRYVDEDAGGYVYFETERMDTSEEDLEYRIGIDDSIEIPEFDPLDYASGVYVGAMEGIARAAAGMVTGLIETPYAIYSTMSALYEFIEKVWGTFTPEEQQQFSEDVGFATASFMLRSVDVAKQDFSELRQTINALVYNGMTDLANSWETGDYVATTQVYAKYAAELGGSIMLPIAAAKLAKAPQIVAVAERGQAALQLAARPLLQSAQKLRLVEELYPILVKLKNGVILDPTDVQRLYGIAPDELVELQKLATKYKYLITVRSRHSSSIKWIREFKAMVKPEALKIKTVSELDIRLGYDTALIDGESPVGALIFKKPKPLAQWDAYGNSGDVGRLVREFVESKGFTPGTADYEAALDRTYLRMKEWRKFEAEYKAYDLLGHVETTYNYKGNAIGTDIRPTGPVQRTGFRLKKVDGQPDTYIVQLMDETNTFRPVTGDIDAVAFTKADGSPLTAKEHADLVDEIRLNEKLQGQHPESVTYDKGGVDFIEDQFKPGEPALQIAPNTTDTRVVRFNKAKTRWNNPRDFSLHWDGGFIEVGRALVDGAARPFQFRLAAAAAFEATKQFLLEATVDGSPNLGRCRVSVSDDAPSSVPLIGTDQGLSIVHPDGSLSPSPLQGQCFGPGPSIDVVVRTSSLLAAAAGSRPLLSADDANAFSLRSGSITVEDDEGFDVGDVVVVGAGEPTAEARRITAVLPLTLDRPLARTHDVGELVVVVDPAPDTAGPGPLPDPTPVGSSLHPLVPVRVVETRAGEVTTDGEFAGIGRLAAGSVTEFRIAGRGGVDPNAAAVALNVTAIRPSGGGYVTLFPCGEEQPVTSSLNYGAGGAVGNSAIVKLDENGMLCAFTLAETDLVIDVNAWLAESDGFASLVPVRLAETRAGERTVDNAVEGIGRLAAGTVTEIPIAGRGGVDEQADAVALNVTAVQPAGVGYVTLFPCDEDRPTTSSLNYSGGGAVGNSAVVSLSASGTLCAFTFADTDLVIDVNAWLSDDETFDALVPARIYETRPGESTTDGEFAGAGRLEAMRTTTVQVAGRGGVPTDAVAVAVNVTAVRPDGVGYVTLFPCDDEQPLTSSLNYAGGGAVGNSGVVKLAADGSLCAFTFAESDLVIDVNAAWTN